MSAALALAPGLNLPIELATEAVALLGKRGAGKTNTAVVIVEELVGVGQPVVVIDPTGVWWGLRSSASGTEQGLPVVIFGGEHADVPMDKGSGDLIARVIVEQQISAVLDMSGLSKTAGRQFVADFLETLYHLNREALHVVIDEADLYAPQRAMGDTARVLGAMEDLVRRGRAHGIGVTVITQRPAVLHKDILGQAEVLIAMRMTGPRDVAAIDEWVSLHDVEDVARDVKASLPSLSTGEAWVWSPSWLGILQRVQVRARRTFDSSATPKPGQRRRVPKTMADIDVAALGEQIAATVEQAKADDPRTLRARIATLERELASANSRALPTIDSAKIAEQIEAGVAAHRRDMAKVLAYTTIDTDSLSKVSNPLDALSGVAEGLNEIVERMREALKGLKIKVPSIEGVKRLPSPEPIEWGPVGPILGIDAAAKAAKSAQKSPGAEPRPDGDARPGSGSQSGGHRGRAHTQPSNLGSGTATRKPAEQKILAVLAQYGPRTAEQIAILSNYSQSGGFRGAMAALRRDDLITGTGLISITEDGLAAAGDVEVLPTGEALRLDWYKHARIKVVHRAILETLAEVWPEGMRGEDIAARNGYSVSGGFRGAMARLRKLDLVKDRGGLSYIADTLMGD